MNEYFKLKVTKRDTIIVWILAILATAYQLGFFQSSVVEVNGIKLQKPFLSKYSATFAPKSVEEDGQIYKVKEGMLLIEFDYSYTFDEIRLGFVPTEHMTLFDNCEDYNITVDDEGIYSASVYHLKKQLLVAVISNSKEDVDSFAKQICKSK